MGTMSARKTTEIRLSVSRKDFVRSSFIYSLLSEVPGLYRELLMSFLNYKVIKLIIETKRNIWH